MLEGEISLISNLANISIALFHTFEWHWVGFYLVQNNQLKLGPFQGPIACTTIEYGKGVCGSAWKDKQPIIVPDVNQFPGHIACSAATQSELVLPFISQGSVHFVLDIDSVQLYDFQVFELDYLKQILSFLAPRL